jgi:hypothetical protein
MNKLIAVFIATSLSAQNFAGEARIKRLKNHKQIKTSVKANTRKRSYDDEILKRMHEQNKKITKLLKFKTERPYIWEGNTRILSGRVYRGTLLNSINSTNLASPVIVMADGGQGLPYKSKFSCFGTTAHKRVQVICNKLITHSKEVLVNTQILNFDGSAGLIGKYDDGKEDYIMGAVISDFAQGVLSVSKSRVTTGLGQLEDSSAGNKIMEGLIRSGETTSRVLLEEMKNMEPIVTVDAGARVLIYFREAVNVL